MTLEFFEGPAGTGKTHNVVARAAELVQQGVLDDGQKLLALTYMNGSRRRLETRLRRNPLFHNRFNCQTFDVFGRTLTVRRRSLVSGELEEQAAALDAFDGPCSLAGALLEIPLVQQWVARTFPLVLVDEAQDLDRYRMRILRGLSENCQILAAADEFQCLTDGRDTASLMGWLETAGQTHRLTEPMRTSKQGLLDAARTVREGGDIRAVLTERAFGKSLTWNGPGFRLHEVPASAPLVAWTISNDIAWRNGPVTILTPDSGNTIVRKAMQTVQTRQWTRKNGTTFGPFQHVWDRQDTQAADELLADITLPQTASFHEMCSVLAPLASHAFVALTIKRIDRLRRVKGQGWFSAAEITELVRENARNQSRQGFQPYRRHRAMTIPRAKNREFRNVILLWPHSATGSPEHMRRLLYNAITRARTHCSVIVLGRERLSDPPFSSTAGE